MVSFVYPVNTIMYFNIFILIFFRWLKREFCAMGKNYNKNDV